MAQRTDIDMKELIGLYFRDMDPQPFEDPEEEQRNFFRFADLLSTILLIRKEEASPASLERVGCIFENIALAETLKPREKTAFPEAGLLLEIWETLLNQSRDLPLGRLMNDSRLFPVEKLAFLLAFCVQRNRKYERIFGELQEQGDGIILPTAGLALDFAGLFLPEEGDASALLLRQDSFLNRFLLVPVRIPEGLSVLSRPLKVSREAFFRALGEDPGPGSLAPFASLRKAEGAPETGGKKSFLCHPELLQELLEICGGMRRFQEKGVVFLEGEDGSGRTFLLEQLASRWDRDLLVLSGRELLAGWSEFPEGMLREILCRCTLRNELLFIKDLPVEGADRRLTGELLSGLQSALPFFFTGGRRFCEDAFPGDLRVHLLKVPFPDAGAQRILWEHFASDLGIRYGEDVEIDHLVSKYSMTPGRIRGLLSAARLHAPEEEDGSRVIGRGLIERMNRNTGDMSFGEFAAKLESSFRWEDLQISGESEKVLRKAMDRIMLKSVVHEDYGFGKKLPYGGGVSIVLYGPPGTGKTMTAEVLANELGMDIYRIDLSQVASKYIGESEKTLGKIFDTAKYSNAILFFDEADSLFAKRTEVKDSNDRHANAETAYLLQKIEEYGGVSILATNVFSNFDEAFRRRMTFLVPFAWPEEEEREKLWQKVFPPETPLAKDVDFGEIAKSGELTGSAIKAAALSAAFCAAKEKRPVCRQDILDAIADEYRKSGRSLNTSEGS